MALGDVARIKVGRWAAAALPGSGGGRRRRGGGKCGANVNACMAASGVLLQAQGGPWQEELLFKVPREHAEVQRLEGRYKR